MKTVFENGMYAVVADPGMVISHGGNTCHKLYRKGNDFSDCTEIEKPMVEDEEITDTEALEILLGGAV